MTAAMRRRRTAHLLGFPLTAAFGGQGAIIAVAKMAPVYHAGRVDEIAVFCAAAFLFVGAGTLAGYVWFRLTEWFMDGAL